MAQQPIHIWLFDQINVFKYISILGPSRPHMSNTKHLFKVHASPESPPHDPCKKPTLAIFNTALVVEDPEQFMGDGVQAHE
ncbi:hypothetical protein PAXINDRAFT_11801 [Paxillus involutus ATCC 200175]|uniref:Uncharacterized protein n=1 Tax=Paxillus involutus ATCC 200175 TaxID=664439 RepID=A0A0C9SYW2_PAXIN|nr:hypothetical protein PAXINDRAFT_11801 [Paxillus involutus ATCC 200175]